MGRFRVSDVMAAGAAKSQRDAEQNPSSRAKYVEGRAHSEPHGKRQIVALEAAVPWSLHSRRPKSAAE